MRKEFAIIATLAVVLLTGCTTPYQGAQSGARARVRLVVEAGAPLVGQAWFEAPKAYVFGFADDNCADKYDVAVLSDSSWAPTTLGLAHRRLEMPLWSFRDNAANEFYMPAGSPQYIMFIGVAARGGYVSTIYTCGVFLSPTFIIGHDYEFVYRLDRGTTCTVTENEIVPSGEGYIRREISSYHSARSEMSDGCRRAFEQAIR